MRFNLAPAVLLALATANTTLAAPRPSRNETRADVGVRPDMIMARNPTHMHMSHVDTVMGRDRDNEKGKEMGKSGSVYEDMGMKADLDRFGISLAFFLILNAESNTDFVQLLVVMNVNVNMSLRAWPWISPTRDLFRVV